MDYLIISALLGLCLLGIFYIHHLEVLELRKKNSSVRFPLQVGDKVYFFSGHMTILEVLALDEIHYSVMYFRERFDYDDTGSTWGIGFVPLPEINEIRTMSENEIKKMIFYS